MSGVVWGFEKHIYSEGNVIDIDLFGHFKFNKQIVLAYNILNIYKQ